MSKDDSTALLRASACGDVEVVEVLLASGVDVEARDLDGSTALMKAALKGHTETVRALLS
eukprot:CAMPEP_0170138692 /NCGR_PEP_ID=MMETSP0033_2-20121228/5114_1 /TAXON_ID=195969 /ORGANISM="Dolichomastix tenuilepis, Strain CCMP3274" /LENGTH=59 /DNA_ID=CAMNT_0010374729 /DNA_START=55 /DNA_END=231 /DNA_ORIENTATION=+